jgi:hypothetical protein
LYVSPEGEIMYRVLTALFLLVASTVASSAQGWLPSVWQSRQGAIFKVLFGNPFTATFSGVFISAPGSTCPGVPYDLSGRLRGHRFVFVTTRRWTSDCSVTATWYGRYVNPTTVVTHWVATFRGRNGRLIRRRGTEVFHRL